MLLRAGELIIIEDIEECKCWRFIPKENFYLESLDMVKIDDEYYRVWEIFTSKKPHQIRLENIEYMCLDLTLSSKDCENGELRETFVLR